MNEFKECATCAAKPGSPTLCDSCYQNRLTISELSLAMDAKKKKKTQPDRDFRMAMAFFASLFLVLGLYFYVDARGIARHKAHVAQVLQEQLSIEQTASITPPLRIIPIEEGRTLDCITFPLRQYDNSLVKCIACREDSMDLGTKPITVNCR